ncbi:MAG: hypothetical protein GXO79_08990 [Chlorobi bacterium]|nr:hypothetical protein [Chlorobiota bacterium]
MYYHQPSIEIFSIRINEPVTMLTDLLVSAVCFYAFINLTIIPVKNKTHLFLRYYFLSMAIATFIGGVIGHGFLYLFSFAWKLPGWLTSMFSIALLERASIEYARKIINPKVGKIFAWINIIELLTFMTLTFTSLNFFFVEVHSAYGLLVVVSSFNLFVYIKTKSKGSKLFLTAVAFAAIAAIIFMNEWGISKWFNHFDISHILMAVSAYFFYKGAKAEIANPLKEVKSKEVKSKEVKSEE